jgi:hypothetical protein
VLNVDSTTAHRYFPWITRKFVPISAVSQEVLALWVFKLTQEDYDQLRAAAFGLLLFTVAVPDPALYRKCNSRDSTNVSCDRRYVHKHRCRKCQSIR